MPMSASGRARPEAAPRPLAVRALRRLWHILVEAPWRLAVDAPYREVRRLDRHPPAGAFQPSNDTSADRYPRIFRFLQAELGAETPARILSFGCSTGEEVFTLRRYFPHATLKGIDINRANIALCRKRLAESGDRAISFEVGHATAAEASGGYDAILCMAVLRHGALGLPGVARSDPLMRFEDFARAIEDFRRCLKPGGLLAIRHSNFRLADAPAGVDFETVLRVETGPGTAIFGPDNRLVPGALYPDAVFRKRRA